MSYGEFADQRAAAALTNNSLFSLRFIPSGVARYFNPSPNFMRITRLFPFVKFGDRATAVGHVPMQLEYSGSIFTAAPALVMFAVVGAVWIVRRGGTAWRVAALGGSLAALTTLGFWAIWHRYLVDFVPVLVVLAVPGLWLVLDAARTRVRWQRAVVGTGVAAVMLLGLVGQVGLSLWSRFFELLPYHQEQLDATRLRYRLDDELFGGTPPGVHLVDADTPRGRAPTGRHRRRLDRREV